MTRRSITSITVEAIDTLEIGQRLRDHLSDGTELYIARFKSGHARPPGSSWYRVAVLDAGGQCLEKHDSREARNVHRQVVALTRKHGGPR